MVAMFGETTRELLAMPMLQHVALAHFGVAVVRLTGVSVFVPAPSMMQPTLLLLSAAEGGRVSLTLV